MGSTLTPPEDRTERENGWKAVDRVKACGGCFCCLNRGAEGFGIAVCGLAPSLTFPACTGKTPGFAPDYDRIYARENIE